MQGEVWRRSRWLVAHVMGEAWDEPVRLPDLVESAAVLVDEQGRPKWSAKTVENTVRDLVAFGALRIAQRGRDRLVSVSVLGRAWVAGVALPPMGGSALEEAATELLDEE